MARGASSKSILTNEILKHFEGSFINDKEIRIPMIEDGELVEIKVTLTAAKTNVGGGVAPKAPNSDGPALDVIAKEEVLTEPSAEEKARLSSLLENLGLNF